MKKKLILISIVAITIASIGCSAIQLKAAAAKVQKDIAAANAFLANPQNQADIKGSAQAVTTLINLTAPFIPNGTAANILSGVQVVANAYSNDVPSNILQATTKNLAITKSIAPLVTNNTRDLDTTNKVIDATIKLLGGNIVQPSPTPTPAS